MGGMMWGGFRRRGRYCSGGEIAVRCPRPLKLVGWGCPRSRNRRVGVLCAGLPGGRMGVSVVRRFFELRQSMRLWYCKALGKVTNKQARGSERMNIKPSMSKRAIRIATAMALVAVMAVVAVSLLMGGVGGATAFDAGASDTAAINIPAQYTEQCSNGIAVPDLANNAGLVSDCAALLASKDTLEGTEGYLNWSADVRISGWRGVTIESDRISRLELDEHLLNGRIPAELGNLANLTNLDLSDNQLTGAIPVELANLANLSSLRLFHNQLTGAIPAELGNIVYLSQLYLGGNRLTGEIPSELGNLSHLWDLGLSDNQLTGAIPVELGNLPNLYDLYLNNNRLTGNIPAQLGNLANVREVHLHSNQLTGTIPAELGNLPRLMKLHLRGNQLTGCIPRSLRVPLGDQEIQEIGLPICGTTISATPTPTATSTQGATATPTATSVPGTSVTPVATLTPTATSVASDEVMDRLTALEGEVAELADLKNQVAVLATKVAQIEGGSGGGAATATPTPTATPSATPTSVAGASGGDGCIERLGGNGSVRGRWAPDCVTANSPDNRIYYARFYTFTLYAASEVTITLASADATPYVFLLEGEGTGGAVRQEKGVADADSVMMTAVLQAGAYTIEASTYSAESGGDFRLEMEVAR